MTLTPARWGTNVVIERIGNHQGRTWFPRPQSLTALLAEAAIWSDAEFIVQSDQRLTFNDALRKAEHAAHWLVDAGVRPRDRVLVIAYNSSAFVLTVLGAWRIGATPVLGNRWWSAEERVFARDLIEPHLTLTDIPGMAAEPGCSSLEALLDTRPKLGELPPADGLYGEDEPALVLFTSGSSGSPKAVVLSHRSVIANQHNLLHRSGRLTQTPDRVPRRTTLLVTLPLFHIGGISNVITAMITGSKLVFLSGRFDEAEVLSVIETEKVTTWGGVPTMARRVVEHPDFPRRDLSSLRSFPLGGAPVTPEVLDLIRRKIPHVRRGLGNSWGLTESGGFLTVATSRDLEERPGTVGRPYPVVEVRTADPDPDGVGELLVRSPTVMTGYFGSEDDGATIDGEGWLRTGDVGWIDEDGYIYVTGRAKEIVIRGGENVACAHVEAVLGRHPAVKEVSVLGVPHRDLGEEVAAAVVLCPGEALKSAELRAWATEHLAYFEVPSRIVFLEASLPVLPTGKVDKIALRSRVMEDTTA